MSIIITPLLRRWKIISRSILFGRHMSMLSPYGSLSIYHADLHIISVKHAYLRLFVILHVWMSAAGSWCSRISSTGRRANLADNGRCVLSPKSKSGGSCAPSTATPTRCAPLPSSDWSALWVYTLSPHLTGPA